MCQHKGVVMLADEDISSIPLKPSRYSIFMIYCFTVHKICSKMQSSMYIIFLNYFKIFTRCARLHSLGAMFVLSAGVCGAVVACYPLWVDFLPYKSFTWCLTVTLLVVVRARVSINPVPVGTSVKV